MNTLVDSGHDSVFFLKARKENCMAFRDAMERYFLASGQLVNLEKSCVFFTKNTPKTLKDDCCLALGIITFDSPGKYLGLPILWGRFKCEALAFDRDRVKDKVLWLMQFQLILCLVSGFLRKLAGNLIALSQIFGGGQPKNEGKIHWASWDKLMKPKDVGGLGFKDFMNSNLALLAKQAWRILNNSNDLWVKILKGI